MATAIEMANLAINSINLLNSANQILHPKQDTGEIDLSYLGKSKDQLDNRPHTWIDNVNSFTGVDLPKWKDQLQDALVKRLDNLQKSGLVKGREWKSSGSIGDDIIAESLKRSGASMQETINANDMINMNTLLNFRDGETKNNFINSSDFIAWKTVNSDQFNQDLKSLNDLTFWNPQIDSAGFAPARQVPQSDYNKSLYEQYIVDKPSIKRVMNFLDENLRKGNGNADVKKDYAAANVLWDNIESIGMAWYDGIEKIPAKPTTDGNNNRNNNDDSFWTWLFGGDPRNGFEWGTWDDFWKGFKDGFWFIPNHIPGAPKDEDLYFYLIIGGVVVLGTIHILNKI